MQLFIFCLLAFTNIVARAGAYSDNPEEVISTFEYFIEQIDAQKCSATFTKLEKGPTSALSNVQVLELHLADRSVQKTFRREIGWFLPDYWSPLTLEDKVRVSRDKETRAGNLEEVVWITLGEIEPRTETDTERHTRTLYVQVNFVGKRTSRFEAVVIDRLEVRIPARYPWRYQSQKVIWSQDCLKGS